MLARVLSGTTVGLDGVLIHVEVDVAGRGFPTCTIVGLPSKAIDEAKDRVRTAIVNTSFEMPDSRITINLAPADIPKDGSAFDLPIAVGILAASGMIEKSSLKNCLFIGELSLEGQVRKVPGVISIVAMAKERGLTHVYIPADNIQEASLIDGIDLYPLVRLSDLVLHLNGHSLLKTYNPPLLSMIKEEKYEIDFADIKGQDSAKRCLEIAACGFHNVHMRGPPGIGKTLLSRAFPSILPPMEKEEIVEVSKIYSIAGLIQNTQSHMGRRPFRSPHHTTSRIGLVGGGNRPSPGEISLAHRGVLFLDEFPEFPRSVIEALRQPLEDGVVTISRAAGSLTFPSRFILLAASNPCPCGYLGHPKKACKCLPGMIHRYRKRLSGPMLDRIDLHIDMSFIDEHLLSSRQTSESSNVIRARVISTRKRIKEHPSVLEMNQDAIVFLKSAVHKLSLSARSYFKIIKIANTIAHLEGLKLIQISHVAESLQYRMPEE